jgi:hypothetical protein
MNCMSRNCINKRLICLIETRPHKVNRKAVPERIGMNVNIDHPAVLLDDVPDLLSLSR